MAGFGAGTPGWVFMPSPLPSLIFIGLCMVIVLIITLNIAIFSIGFNIRTSWVKMGWVGLGPRIFDLPDVGLGTNFRQPNQPNNPLGQGNPSGRPYRAGTLVRTKLAGVRQERVISRCARNSTTKGWNSVSFWE